MLTVEADNGTCVGAAVLAVNSVAGIAIEAAVLALDDAGRTATAYTVDSVSEITG